MANKPETKMERGWSETGENLQVRGDSPLESRGGKPGTVPDNICLWTVHDDIDIRSGIDMGCDWGQSPADNAYVDVLVLSAQVNGDRPLMIIGRR